MPLGLPLSEKQIPQVIENLESGDKPKEVLEGTVMRPRQVRYQAALRPDFIHSTSLRKRGLGRHSSERVRVRPWAERQPGIGDEWVKG